MTSTHTVLDSVALGYQPVWNRLRQLAAVRMPVLVLHRESVDGEHFVRALGNDWPKAAPSLIIAPRSLPLVDQLLHLPPIPNTWLEVPGDLFATPEGLARMAVAARQGHRLLRRVALSAIAGEVVAPADVRSLVHLAPEDVLATLRSLPTEPGGAPRGRSPLMAGHIYEGIANRVVAEHALDTAGAWGVLGWPVDDTLRFFRQRPLACDRATIQQVTQALGRECSLDQLERLIRQDPVMVYRVLFLVNSAMHGKDREITSLRHAIMMLGFTVLGRWLSEQLPGAETDLTLHPVRYTMVMQARLAQHLLDSGSDDNLRSEVYVTALFAQLDRLLHQPLPEILQRLPLPGRVYDALLRQTGPYNAYLDVSDAQGQTEQLHRLPQICEKHDISLESANQALIRMLATSRDHRQG